MDDGNIPFLPNPLFQSFCTEVPTSHSCKKKRSARVVCLQKFLDCKEAFHVSKKKRLGIGAGAKARNTRVIAFNKRQGPPHKKGTVYLDHTINVFKTIKIQEIISTF